MGRGGYPGWVLFGERPRGGVCVASGIGRN